MYRRAFGGYIIEEDYHKPVKKVIITWIYMGTENSRQNDGKI